MTEQGDDNQSCKTAETATTGDRNPEDNPSQSGRDDRSSSATAPPESHNNESHLTGEF